MYHNSRLTQSVLSSSLKLVDIDNAKSQPISALIITKNEEKKIARCLASLTWADEIVIVDAKSSDRTAEICKDPTAVWASKVKFFERDWTGFKDQRNYSLDQASNNWVLVVDADEKCSPELASKLKTITSSGQNKYFKVRRVEYFLGKEIKRTIWAPSWQDRFFYKDGIRYVNDIHEYPPYPNTPDRIAEPLFHSPDFHVDQFLDKMNKYTTIEARNRVDAGMRTNVFRIFFAFPAMFLKTFFYYGGYKDGMHGFIISLLEGVSRVVRHIKIWQHQNGYHQLEKFVDKTSDHG